MKIADTVGAWDKPSPLLWNSSLVCVYRRTSSIDFVLAVSFPSSILVCLVPLEASPLPLVRDRHPEHCRWRKGVHTHTELWRLPFWWTCGMWYCSNIPPNVSIWPIPVVVPKRSSEGNLRAICSQSLFVRQSAGGNSFVPTIRNSFVQKILMNCLSRSLTMFRGSSCRWKTSLKNNSATCAAWNSEEMAKKCVYFVNLSTTTKIQSFPFTLGSPVMKSIQILSHLCFGVGSGCNNPTGRVCSDLFCW